MTVWRLLVNAQYQYPHVQYVVQTGMLVINEFTGTAFLNLKVLKDKFVPVPHSYCMSLYT